MFQYADNEDNVQHYTAGQVVPIEIDIEAPHTGVAVSNETYISAWYFS